MYAEHHEWHVAEVAGELQREQPWQRDSEHVYMLHQLPQYVPSWTCLQARHAEHSQTPQVLALHQLRHRPGGKGGGNGGGDGDGQYGEGGLVAQPAYWSQSRAQLGEPGGLEAQSLHFDGQPHWGFLRQ